MEAQAVESQRVTRLEWAERMRAAVTAAGFKHVLFSRVRIDLDVHVAGFEVGVYLREEVRFAIEWCSEGRPDSDDYMQLAEAVAVLRPLADEYDAAFAAGLVAP